MKFIYLFTVILIFNCNTILSQDTLNFRKKENYNLALDYYRNKSKINPNNGYYFYKLSCAYSMVDSIDKSFKNIIYSIQLGFDLKYILADTDLNNLRKNDKWILVKTKLKEKYLSSNNNITHPNLSFYLLESFVEDQRFRTLRSLYKLDTFPKNHSKIIETNIRSLIDTIKLNGWPLYSQVGKDAGNYVFFIFQHSDNKIMKKVLPLLINAAKIGQADQAKAAMMIDRFLMNHFQSQLYGTQVVSYINGKNASFLYKIADEINLKERRNKVGLKPIEEYCLDMGVEYIQIENRKNFKNLRIRKRWIKKGYLL